MTHNLFYMSIFLQKVKMEKNLNGENLNSILTREDNEVWNPHNKCK